MTGSNITIEALFEGDTQILYVELRDRAETANMPMPDFHTAFTEAVKTGQIELDTIGNVKLMSAGPRKYYDTRIMGGRKAANQLCERLKAEMQNLLDNVATSKEGIDFWKAQVQHTIDYLTPQYPRCKRPFVDSWHDKNTQYLTVYANDQAYVTGGYLFQIKVEEL